MDKDKKIMHDVEQEIINDEKYHVEIANDFTIPMITNQLIEVNRQFTGLTTGFIPREFDTTDEPIKESK
ncbi:MAG TPA: hypothetical protein VIK84_01020 [Haloplasmataceae bacterium]